MLRRLLEYAAAISLIALLAFILWLILTPIINQAPVVGQATIANSESEIIPIENEIYRIENNTKVESRRIELEEFADTLPEIPYDAGFSSKYEDDSRTDGFYFTIYNDDLTVAVKRNTAMQLPDTPGIYIICIECYWGTARENIGMEYYFKLNML